MLNQKSILLTGGTGSFGKKFLDLVLKKFRPKRIIVFSRDELKQFELQRLFPVKKHPNIRYFLGDIRDRNRLYRAFEGVDVVIHAAALKQVPACEYNPFEAIQTNVIGAKNIIDAAIDKGVSKVVALSTDKAVSPANLYGATKLCAERLFISGNFYAGGVKTRFSCVRYGNVLGSRGSVIPVFLQQSRTGNITVTDEKMTRFWITLDQAVELVLTTLKEMRGGEIFVPKIPSMKVTDLAKAIAPKCKMVFTGIRPGEKLHESLISLEEGRRTVKQKGVFMIKPEFIGWKSKFEFRPEPLPKDFVYTSDTNDEWLNIRQLGKMVRDLIQE